MSKASVLLMLLALATTGLSAGLWFSQPPDLSGRVAQLERELREAQSTIAKLKSGSSGLRDAIASGPGSQGSISSGSQGLGSTSYAGGASGSGSGSTFQPVSHVLPAAPAPAPAPPPPDENTAASAPPPAPMDTETMRSLAAAEANHAGLINQFNLSAAEKERFKQLAAERGVISRKATSRLQDPSLTDEQRKAIYANAEQEMGANDTAVRQFLNNDDDFRKFLTWEQSGVDRAQVEMGRAIFENDGVPLSSPQEDWLVGSLFNMRQESIRQNLDPYNLKSVTQSKVDPGYIQRALDKYDRDSRILLQSARDKFNPTQLNSLGVMRAKDRVNLEARLYNLFRTQGVR